MSSFQGIVIIAIEIVRDLTDFILMCVRSIGLKVVMLGITIWIVKLVLIVQWNGWMLKIPYLFCTPVDRLANQRVSFTQLLDIWCMLPPRSNMYSMHIPRMMFIFVLPILDGSPATLMLSTAPCAMEFQALL